MRCFLIDQVRATQAISMVSQSSYMKIGDSPCILLTMFANQHGRCVGAAVFVSPANAAATCPNPCASVRAPTGRPKRTALRGVAGPRVLRTAARGSASGSHRVGGTSASTAAQSGASSYLYRFPRLVGGGGGRKIPPPSQLTSSRRR